ncbi:MAG: DnaD domain protein [Oscillospiraceae bacterium]|nr:DnaD domain protein [Oscillospiraceae bacterium]
MYTDEVKITGDHMHKLLSAASGDAALLYLYIAAGNTPEDGEKALRFGATRYACAAATLRQLGLWPEKKNTPVFSGERPRYSERDVVIAMEESGDFKALYGEVQRLMGRTLNTEELKILLGIVNYLGMPMEVVSVLFCYCKDRARQKNLRTPSLRSIEKEAYAWAEQGIDSIEEAAAYIQRQNFRQSQVGKIMETLQIRGRKLTPAEAKYAQQWVEWGFQPDVIAMAYERTCINTGGLNWPYMNRILSRWQENGLMRPEEIKGKDVKPAPKGAKGELAGEDYAAIQRILQED